MDSTEGKTHTKRARSCVVEGKTGGRARLLCCWICGLGGVDATRGSMSQGETRSGRTIVEGSSH